MNKSKLATVDIKGKKYATVDARVEFFREKFPTWSLETEFPVLDLIKGICLCRVVVKNEEGRIMADGYAHEWQSKPGSMVNKTSYIENAQTSAVGRALGFIGIGVNGMGIASAEEVATAIAHQDANDFPPVIDDEVPYSQPAPETHPDNWLTVNAFSGMCDRASTVAELQTLVNGQRGNPHMQELIEIAGKRKQQIITAETAAAAFATEKGE